MTKLEFKVRNKGVAEADWPQFRIDTTTGETVAEVFGDANQDLGRVMAAAPELFSALRAVQELVNGIRWHDEDERRKVWVEVDRAIDVAKGRKP